MKNTIILTLIDHCIETACRKERDRLADRLLDGVEDRVAEEQFQLLTRFIRDADFPSLRASDPRFSGEVPSKVRLEEKDGSIVPVPLDAP
jgi:hypothetical protein